jgi:hypothetical protein
VKLLSRSVFLLEHVFLQCTVLVLVKCSLNDHGISPTSTRILL